MEAANQRTASDPLVIIAHSMGGIIAYDILSNFAPNVTADVLCTVGSQVGLFEEMKLFVRSDNAVTQSSGRKVAKPANITNWINVFDYNDVLSYRLEPVFDEVIDYLYPSGSLLHAHGAYFSEPTFYRRLADRVREARDR
jgi:pimeloyl-ACP methyl ester carboxylesterase